MEVGEAKSGGLRRVLLVGLREFFSFALLSAYHARLAFLEENGDRITEGNREVGGI